MEAEDVMREELAKLVSMTRKSLESEDDAAITTVLESIDANLSVGGKEDDGKISHLARLLLNALSTSGLANNVKVELSKRARCIWKGWKVDLNDIEYMKKRNGDRRRLGKGGQGDVFLARMKKRDENGDIIDGQYIEVAVKHLTVNRSQVEEVLPQFIREVFLQMHAQHPCIVEVFGGYWLAPDKEDDDQEAIEAIIVMERMSHNLRGALNGGLLQSIESKRRVLHDIAEGMQHLHGSGIVHRDIKPENILLRMVDGKMRAKVSDFGVSRRAEVTDSMSHTMEVFTKPIGTAPYMPPEAYSSSARDANKRGRDVWSFGVLICVVLDPEFLANVRSSHPDASRIEFAKKVTEAAQIVSGDWTLVHILLSCLLFDPMLRPKFEDICTWMANDAPADQFNFRQNYTLDYRANEVLRYVRNRFGVEERTSNLECAVAILEEATEGNRDLSAQSVLAYCLLYGIGVVEDKKQAFEMFLKGSLELDPMALLFMGFLHYAAKDYEHATPMITKASELGNVNAKHELALWYQSGTGVEKDVDKAFALMSLAAEAGNIIAQVDLAGYYRNGIGTEQDEEKGFDMLQRLTRIGSPQAAITLALGYKRGYSVRKDKELAKQLEFLASKRGLNGEWVFSWWSGWKFVPG